MAREVHTPDFGQQLLFETTAETQQAGFVEPIMKLLT
ncbi:MAG: hypothetical protein UU73_C0001G0325 [Candidatus Daviesbacteria bacterium GW2011_GWA1_41_61]|uniref:Uncharacterized protein n=1 Tax=Candidatus Daviesbacteria bacterium GW2011_GWA2_40_9 TaxID=1618424 RepID=A0A0G0X4G0_9BACT|nr:MAG: hypothetical protein UU26_C0025G0011 [Candidatus Daviesbacteria bacterium GW2011_GWC1_40_9]KKR82497.1 MAG: hypothetical protein UU29_C0012G0035 [Candidatus Daviesbacteria bacterium GW2011_GWA2_40_9]KKR93144.1 MAG: hypothetical protein UU44_C0004G0326 [Candidatus Daviesbacteria bacterium GW2011_GWB1_41_15]KKS15688.1 MAG: hypothetical protein UU73_C0001G0325 [Candidatus Daviesbacteria bacterium GW2011_GWA1_41_61]